VTETSSELVMRPAATAILLRRAGTEFEVLMMRRAAQLAFHGGAWVFPGGRVDPEDGHAGDALAAARCAAVRETREEAGLTLREHDLLPFSHWTTPGGLARRFATWFFVASVEAGLSVQIDGSEIHDYRWLTPGAALALHRGLTLELPPPTYVTLAVLSRFDAVEAVLEHARSTTPTVFVPRPQAHPQGLVSLYQGDSAYENSDLECPGPRHRLCMFRDGWRYER
jgi:8-oxo-dGTP pyrophosphatase MutT (NUDIX family)